MAKTYDHISDQQRQFIEQQHVFFVASAPLSAEGHVNVSPKGLDCFRVLGPNQVVYLDVVGSGNETSAHLLENGRITLMFCAFEGPPNILRLYGRGRTILPQTDGWDALIGLFPALTGIRQIIIADIDRVQTSCGYGVPLMDFVDDRDTQRRWAEAKGAAGLVAYQQQFNTRSIDQLPTALALQQTESDASSGD